MLKIVNIHIEQCGFSVTYSINGTTESTSFLYNSVDFSAFEKQELFYIILHIVAFDVTKFQVRVPTQIDWGILEKFVTPNFMRLWQVITHNIWMQWKYENNMPLQTSPTFVATASNTSVNDMYKLPHISNTNVLNFCGGGKDSIVAMKILSDAGIPFSVFSYSSSVYGNSDYQQTLTESSINHFNVQQRHQLKIESTFNNDSTATETPLSIFAAIPISLQHGYTLFSLAHEQSADVGQVFWEDTGEYVNHQWGKSQQCEKIINNYINQHLIKGLKCFSPIRPIYDPIIFYIFSQLPVEVIQTAHSCNVRKPWCGECAKCVYVWLSYLAYLDNTKVSDIIPKNFLERESTKIMIQRLISNEVPFECVGQSTETKIALALCKMKQKSNVNALVNLDFDKFFTVNSELAKQLPLLSVFTPILLSHADDAKLYLKTILESTVREDLDT